MNAFTISQLIGSAHNLAFADDTLKDEDNAAWVLTLSPEVRSEWIERIRWIRLVDRLAEKACMTGDRTELEAFQAGWNHLVRTRQVPSGSAHQSLLIQMQQRWFGPRGATQPRAIRAWNSYLAAIAQYHTRHLTVTTVAQFEAMLINLAGSFFQILPFLPESYWQAAACFGAVDQFYNNLRDLREDTEQRVCYLPREVLHRFRLDPADLLSGQAIAMPHYRQLMQFWLDEYLPQLRQRAAPFIQATDLPLCWQILRDWSLQRYQRIERIFRACEFDYFQFPDRYWHQVKQDLPGLLVQAQQTQKQFVEPPTTSPLVRDPITAAQLQYAVLDTSLPAVCCSSTTVARWRLQTLVAAQPIS